MSKIEVRAPVGYKIESYRKWSHGEKHLGQLDSEGRGLILKRNLVQPERIIIGQEVYFQDSSGELKEGKLYGYLNGWFYNGRGGMYDTILVDGDSFIQEVEVPDPPGFQATHFGLPQTGERYLCYEGINTADGSESASYIIVQRCFSQNDLGKQVHGTGKDSGVRGRLVAIQNHSEQSEKVFYMVKSCDGLDTCESVELDSGS